MTERHPSLSEAPRRAPRGHRLRSAEENRRDEVRQSRGTTNRPRRPHDAALDVAAAEHQAAAQNHAHTVVELDTEQLRQLSAVFSSPRWLRDLGIAAWLLVGVAALLVGLTWIAGLTSTIMEPVLVGLVVATVASPR